MAGDLVGGAFDPVGVVPGAFDGAGTGTVTAWRVGVLADFGDHVRESVVQVLRG
jgi:hypothetical protein